MKSLDKIQRFNGTTWESISIDANTLEGKNSSYFLNYNNLVNKPTIPSLSGYATQAWVENTATALKSTQLKAVTSDLNLPANTNTVDYRSAVTKDKSGIFTTSNNANGVLTFNKHPGNYDSQLGFNGDGQVFYRSFSGKAIGPTTPWKKFLFAGEDIDADFVNGEPGKDIIPQMGVPRGNLGTPSIFEIACIDQEWTNKMDFMPPENLSFEISANGKDFVETTMSETNKKRLVGGDNSASIHIQQGTFLRLTIIPRGYVYLNALYLYQSTNGNRHKYKIEAKKHSTQEWETIVDFDDQIGISDWPGHVILRHPRIAFTATNHSDAVRLTIENVPHPTNNNSSDIYKLQWWGGYPYGQRNMWQTDENKNVRFPARLQSYSGSIDSDLAVGRNASIQGSITSHNGMYTESMFRLLNSNSKLQMYNTTASPDDYSTIEISSNKARTLFIQPSAGSVVIGDSKKTTITDSTKFKVEGDSILNGNATIGVLSTIGGATFGSEVTATSFVEGTQLLSDKYAAKTHQHTFTGTPVTLTDSYTPSGTISAPTITVKPSTTTITEVTGKGSLPTLTSTYDATTQTVSLVYTQGSLITTTDTQVMTSASATSSTPSFTGTSGSISISYTPTGSISHE